jgi:predicted dehydrogenase
MNIAVIGGGRWARVIASVLHDFFPEVTQISMHSPGNADQLRAWISENHFKRVFAKADWPDYFAPSRPKAVIVANAAAMHFPAAVAAILSRIPVLIEKPLAMSARDAAFLVSLAQNKGTELCSAHIFLFADYIQKFGNMVRQSGTILKVHFCWSDPEMEHRYGEVKNYDATLPVFQDIIPHIFSILRSFWDDELSFDGIQVESCGAKITVITKIGSIPCSLRLERNSALRNRVISVETESDVIELDFSIEPGTITSKAGQESGDDLWNEQPRPMRKMLGTFINAMRSNKKDSRFNAELSIESCRFSDKIYDAYLAEMATILGAPPESYHNKDIEYSYSEIFHQERIDRHGWKTKFIENMHRATS